jgi:hypothetical protein
MVHLQDVDRGDSLDMKGSCKYFEQSLDSCDEVAFHLRLGRVNNFIT